jgi:hypothetical protein
MIVNKSMVSILEGLSVKKNAGGKVDIDLSDFYTKVGVGAASKKKVESILEIALQAVVAVNGECEIKKPKIVYTKGEMSDDGDGETGPKLSVIPSTYECSFDIVLKGGKLRSALDAIDAAVTPKKELYVDTYHYGVDRDYTIEQEDGADYLSISFNGDGSKLGVTVMKAISPGNEK